MSNRFVVNPQQFFRNAITRARECMGCRHREEMMREAIQAALDAKTPIVKVVRPVIQRVLGVPLKKS